MEKKEKVEEEVEKKEEVEEEVEKKEEVVMVNIGVSSWAKTRNEVLAEATRSMQTQFTMAFPDNDASPRQLSGVNLVEQRLEARSLLSK